jgi:hypothetical protein
LHAPEARWLLGGEKHRFRKSLRLWWSCEESTTHIPGEQLLIVFDG